MVKKVLLQIESELSPEQKTQYDKISLKLSISYEKICDCYLKKNDTDTAIQIAKQITSDKIKERIFSKILENFIQR